MSVNWSSLYRISYRDEDNLINSSISISVICRGSRVVDLDASANVTVKRSILVLRESGYYFKTSPCNLLGKDVAGYTSTVSAHGQKSSANPRSSHAETIKVTAKSCLVTFPSFQQMNPPAKRSRIHTNHLMLHFSFLIAIHLAVLVVWKLQ